MGPITRNLPYLLIAVGLLWLADAVYNIMRPDRQSVPVLFGMAIGAFFIFVGLVKLKVRRQPNTNA